jgi:hypothetical protein
LLSVHPCACPRATSATSCNHFARCIADGGCIQPRTHSNVGTSPDAATRTFICCWRSYASSVHTSRARCCPQVEKIAPTPLQ